ncbi:PKD domain-containing protein [Maribacter litoralis]|uniref:PKD domain-containing protein n=1 Tax=Maribacter litoralis TaxID=2059726 RepID=UPI000E315FE8|nr:PKD domain-containing protein [Maribacter litoralis]
MKKNYLTKINSIKKLFITISVVGSAVLVMSFGPMFLGPGLTNPEPFNLLVDSNFSQDGTATDPYEVAFPNLDFDTPLNFNIVPGQNKIVIGQRDGKVFWFDNVDNTTDKNLVIDLSNEVGVVWDGGFLGLSIHPQFGTGVGKDYFFIYYTSVSESGDNTLNDPDGFSCGVETFHDNYLLLERFEVEPSNLTFVTGSRVPMIKRRMYNTTHRGGGMEFGDDGYLYLSTGDQAAYVNAQDIAENLDGGVLRIDVDKNPITSHAPIRTLASPGAGDSDEFSGIEYFIPNDNPFPSQFGDTFEEYYSMGHRNPHRMTKDRDTGVFYIGEVGEVTHEEINVLSAGKNYGWPVYEATMGPNTSCVTELYNDMPHELPLVEFQRSEASSIIGGYVYRGTDIPSLQGKYICADYGPGNEIWQVDINNGSKQLLGEFTPAPPVSFGQDQQGELYILSYGAGVKLYKLTTSLNQGGAPLTLSQTGAFTDLSNLTVSSGYLPYEMIDPFWSDGASKKRWMAIPNDGSHDLPEEKIQWSENGDWQFPIGTVIIKHFDYPVDDTDPSITRKVETRFSIKGTDGQFYYLTYKWREDQTDADLVNMELGDDETIEVDTGNGTRDVVWHYPSNTECITCHDPALGGTLGPRTRSLNKDFDYGEKGGTVGNQLVTLSALGILDEVISDTDTPGYLKHVALNDPNGTLEEKARTYLDNNCAYCHQPATGNRANFDLRLFNSLAQTGLLTAGVNQTIPSLGDDQKILLPGDAAKSHIYARVNNTTAGIMMPPLAKNQIDEEGVAMLQQWINGMDPIAPTPGLDTYRLVNYETNATLQLAENSNDTGVNVQEGGYEGLDYQHWAFEDAGEAGYYRFKAVSSNRYMDVAGFGEGLGVNVWQWSDNGSAPQQWEIVDAGDNTFFIISRFNGNFLSVEPNGNVIVGTDDGSDKYKWKFLPTYAPFEIGIDVQGDQMITSEDGTTDDFSIALKSAPAADVVVLIEVDAVNEVSLSETEFTFTTTNWQTPQMVTVTGLNDDDVDGVQFYNIEIAIDNTRSDTAYAGFIENLMGYNEDNDGGIGAPPAPGIYRIINVNSNLSAQVVDAGTDNRVNIAQGLYQGDEYQQFELVYRENGLYSIEAVHSGKVMDVELGIANPGTNVWQFTFDGSTPQLWAIEDAGENTYHIVSELAGYYLGIDDTGNMLVDVDNGSDKYKWRFEDITALGNTGIAVSQDLIITSEDGLSDTFTVELKTQPTATVTIDLQIIEGVGEVSLDKNQLVFTDATWNVPQIVTVTGENDDAIDGIQDFTIEAVVAAPFNDPLYSSGLGDSVSGLNYDNDEGANSAPLPGIYQIRNVGNQKNIMPDAGDISWQVNMLTDTYDASEYQHFELIAEGNGLYSIRLTQQDAMGRDLYLDNQYGSTDPGTNIWSYIANNGNTNIAQHFEIASLGDGSYSIISALSTSNYLTVEPDGNLIADINGDTDFFKWQFLPTGFPPEAIASADINSGNAPLEIQFTGNTSTDDKNDIVAYLWDFGNGDTTTDVNPNYEFLVGGVYNVSLTVTDGDGFQDRSEEIEIIVNGAPVAVATSDITEGEVPLEVSFTGDQSTDDVGIVDYLWDFKDGTVSSDANPVHTFDSVGTYEVELTVTDADGLTNSTTITITVSPVNGAPVAVATSDIAEGEVPLEVSFTGDQSTDDVGIVDYLWDFKDGTVSSDANPVHTFDSVGTYEVELTVTDADGLTNSTTITITVSPVNGAPVAVATSDIAEGEVPLEVSFTGDQSTDDVGIVDYLWDFKDGTVSSDANPVHTFDSVGTYEVELTVTDTDGLTNSTTITITVTEENIVLEQPSFDFILAPNPSIDYVEVIMKENFNVDEIIGVMMHDSAGRLIRQFMVTEVLQDGKLRIPTNSYRNEVYVITLMFNNNEPVSKRLIIQ